MPEDTTMPTPIEGYREPTDPNPTKEVKAVRKKEKGVARPNRNPEDCYMENPKKMSDKERNDVILFFQASIEEIQAKYKALDSNTQGAFAQARQLQDKNGNLEREARAKISLLKQNISTLYQNSLLIEMEGDR